VTPGWDRVHRADAPQSVQDASRGFQPRVEGDRRPTTGSYRSTGDTSSTPVSSGRDPSLSQDLDHSRINSQSGRPLPVAPDSFDHAEARPAQQTRTDGRDTEVVVDNTTCGSRTFDAGSPTSCDTLLPGMIPEGSRMTVWGSVDGGQTFFRRVIDGTGSLIR
jgi:hypothetical protein